MAWLGKNLNFAVLNTIRDKHENKKNRNDDHFLFDFPKLLGSGESL